VQKLFSLTGVLLTAILGLAFAIRYGGVPYGLPIVANTDELPIVMNAARIAATGDLNPHFFNYPSLYIYLEAAWFKLNFWFSDYQTMGQMQRPELLHAGRVLTVIMATATVLLGYLSAATLWSRAAGLTTAALIGFGYLHITQSYLIAVDVPAACLAAAAFYLAARLYVDGPKWPYYIIGGLLAGLAMGTKYTLLFACLPLVLAHFLSKGRCDRRDRCDRLRESSETVDRGIWSQISDKKLIIGMGLVPCAFLLSSPYVLLDFNAFWSAIQIEGQHYAGGHAGAETGGLSYGAYLGILIKQFGIPGLFLAALGAIMLFNSDRRTLALVAVFPLVYFLFIGRYPVYFARNLTAIIPFLAILGGAAVALTQQRLASMDDPKVGRWAGAALVAVLLLGLVPQTVTAQRHIQRITLPDTRHQAVLWATVNLPFGARILVEPHTPAMGQIYNDEGTGARFRVQNLKWSVSDVPLTELTRFDYLVVSSTMYHRFTNHPEKYPREAAYYRVIFELLPLAQQFQPNQDTLSGPEIRIYRVPRPNIPPRQQ
jgi:hypothetical protein